MGREPHDGFEEVFKDEVTEPPLRMVRVVRDRADARPGEDELRLEHGDLHAQGGRGEIVGDRTSSTYSPRRMSSSGKRGPAYSQMAWPRRSGVRAKRPRPQSHGATKQKSPRPNADAVNAAAQLRAASTSGPACTYGEEGRWREMEDIWR